MATKRIYVAIAQAIQSRATSFASGYATKDEARIAHATLEGVAQDLARIFSNENAAFDHGRFMQACAVLQGGER